MKNNFNNNNVKKFLLSEGQISPPTLKSYIQALSEILSSLSPKTISDMRRLEIAKENIRNIQKFSNRLEEENRNLQERLRTLEETQQKTRK